MTKLKISVKFLEMEWQPQEKDKDAAWDLYMELLTRTVTFGSPGEKLQTGGWNLCKWFGINNWPEWSRSSGFRERDEKRGGFGG